MIVLTYRINDEQLNVFVLFELLHDFAEGSMSLPEDVRSLAVQLHNACGDIVDKIPVCIPTDEES